MAVSDSWFAERGVFRRQVDGRTKLVCHKHKTLHVDVKKARALGGYIIGNSLRYGIVKELIGLPRKVEGVGKGIAYLGGSTDIILIRNEYMLNRYLVTRMDAWGNDPFVYKDPEVMNDFRVLGLIEHKEELDWTKRGLNYYFDPKFVELSERVIEVRMFPIVGDIGLVTGKGFALMGLECIRFDILGRQFKYNLYSADKEVAFTELSRFIEDVLQSQVCNDWP